MGCGSSSAVGVSTSESSAAYAVPGANAPSSSSAAVLAGGGATPAASGLVIVAPKAGESRPSPASPGSSATATSTTPPHGAGHARSISGESASANVNTTGRKGHSKRLTLPMPLSSNGSGHGHGGSGGGSGSGVGTTTLNLALIGADVSVGGVSSGGLSARSRSGRPTPPGSARRRGEEAEHEMLISIPFFESLDKRAIHKLRTAFQRRKYAEGEWICRRPDASSDPSSSSAPAASVTDADFFVIISGSVQLSVSVLTGKTAHKEMPVDPTAAVTQPRTSLRPDPNLLPAMESEDVTLAVLKDGQWFGAEALVQDSFEKADILALTDCVLWTISREAFRSFAQDIPSMQTNVADVVTNTRVSLHSLPFFANVDELKLQQLSQLLEFRRFKTSDIIVKEGEIGEGFFIIVSGSVRVTVQTRENSTFLLHTLSTGDHFGETALLTSGPCVATVSASSQALMLFLSAQRFRRFERLAPEVFSEAFSRIEAQRTTQLLKTIPLFDVLCAEKPNGGGATARKRGISAEAAAALAESPADAPLSVTVTAPPVVDPPPAPAAESNSDSVANYDEQKLLLLASLFKYENINLPGTIVFSEGDRADKLYILVRGSVEVSARVESGTVVLNRLGQGDHFGEISLIFPTVRSASITTLEPCLLLTLAADKFARFLAIAPALKESLSFAIGPRVATIIENVPFFRNEIRENKPWSKLGLLGELCQFEKAEENEVIFRAGDRGDKFFVIVAGAVLVTKDDEAGSKLPPIPGSDPAALAAANGHGHARSPTIPSGVILRRGNYFGEDSLIDSSAGTRWGTVTSLALSVFLTLTRDNFEKYVRIAPELRELILSRQQSSGVAGVPDATRVKGRRASVTHTIMRVAANQSLDSSPIFSTTDAQGAEFTPSRRVAEQHPHLSRLAAAAASTPSKVRSLQTVPRAVSVETAGSTDTAVDMLAVQRVGIGRLSSLPTLGSASSGITVPTATAAANSIPPMPAGPASPSERHARLPSLSKRASTSQAAATTNDATATAAQAD